MTDPRPDSLSKDRLIELLIRKTEELHALVNARAPKTEVREKRKELEAIQKAIARLSETED